MTAYEHALATAVEWEVQGAPPPVCADMKAWTASGYRALSSASKAFDHEWEAVVNPVTRLLKRMPEGSFSFFSNPLSRYEGGREKALARRINKLQKQHKSELKSVFNVSLHIKLALGVISEAELRRISKLSEAPKPSPEGAKRQVHTQPAIHTIVTGTVHGGPTFSITGTRRSSPRSNVSLEVELANEDEAGGMQREEGELGAALPRRSGRADPFAWQIRTGCEPHEFAIFYGILKASRDTVLVRESDGLDRLRRAKIPQACARMRCSSIWCCRQRPANSSVRKPDGKTIFAEKLVGVGREVTETCEGEAEGPLS